MSHKFQIPPDLRSKLAESGHHGMDQAQISNLAVPSLSVRNLFNLVSDKLGTTDFFIAGGAARDLYEGLAMPRNDIDVFFYSEDTARSVSKRIKDGFGSLVFEFNQVRESEHSICFSTNVTPTEVIKLDLVKRPETSILSCLLRFDYTCCAFALDGEGLYATTAAMDAVREKMLEPSVCGFETPLKSILRIAKYTERGYKISPKHLRKMLKALGNSNENILDKLEEMTGENSQ
jgi:hypothetical protein